MTIEPNELAAIKASVSVAVTQAFPPAFDLLGSAIGTTILDAIDAGAADAAARRVIIFDADTGEEIMPTSAATGPTREIMAAQLLPGMPVELISKAYSDWLETDADPRPFPIGARVRLKALPLAFGRVTSRAEHEGELHTVAVVWEGEEAALYYSPRQLEQVASA